MKVFCLVCHFGSNADKFVIGTVRYHSEGTLSEFQGKRFPGVEVTKIKKIIFLYFLA